MCRLGDLIDNRPLLELIQSINSGDNPEFTTLLQKSLSPLVADSKFVSFTGWNIDVLIRSKFNGSFFINA